MNPELILWIGIPICLGLIGVFFYQWYNLINDIMKGKYDDIDR